MFWQELIQNTFTLDLLLDISCMFPTENWE
jgi:hypothetical protein